MIEELKTTYSAKERAEMLLSSLERLKSQVSATETRYDILTADYTKICDDAISKLSAVKAALANEVQSQVGELEIFKPGMSSLEARFRLGLVPVETYLQEKGRESTAPSPAGLQLAINKAADAIEFALDKMGDGIIAVGEKIISIGTAYRKW